ncbi:alpha/beta hydrolase [Paenibacillus sp. SYP-B3998]|uniref:Alpha/beta hydrolase n=1 Tax=Paenibacillus sp. SYP-B3998 TaxID=2678564 RepID=A0A6G3ZVZ2_9BACL|nr:alpha/beta hydrolase-fold protein [Paenibacillus sp. SYP-B3998]NEW06383.1 alpha/beta hydrolase [Paenibacillus sp. SYP-B3998]
MNGTITTQSFKGRRIAIYLPPSYQTIGAKFPVVYVQDGEDLFDPLQSNSLAVLEDMFAKEALEQLILVGIQPKHRIDEYTPWSSKALADRFPDFGGRGSEYVSFIVDELKPYIDQEHRTKTDADHTGMIGASFGGLISMYAANLQPTVFGRIGSISGSFWFEGFTAYMKKETPRATDRRVYMYVGGAEGAGKTNIQKDMVARNEEVFQLLLEHGYPHENVCLNIEKGATHEWRYFTKRFPEALKWMFPRHDDREGFN